jgi:hypothetical protein
MYLYITDTGNIYTTVALHVLPIYVLYVQYRIFIDVR